MTKISLPNQVTLARLLMTPFFIILVMQVPRLPYCRTLAFLMFCAMVVGDVVDGYLARRMGLESRLGAFLDPVADKAMMVSAYVLLATRAYFGSPLLPDWLAVLVVSRDFFIVLGFVILYMMTGEIFIEPTRVGKATAAFQMATVIAAFLNAGLSSRVLNGLIWATAALTVTSGIDYFFLGLRKLDENI